MLKDKIRMLEKRLIDFSENRSGQMAYDDKPKKSSRYVSLSLWLGF